MPRSVFAQWRPLAPTATKSALIRFPTALTVLTSVRGLQ